MSKRLKFFLSHLSISFLIALLVIGLVFFVWYPAPLAKAVGVINIFLMMLAIDVIVGPILGLLIYKEGKKILKFDLTVIITIQIIALCYGIYSIEQGRPAWLAYNIDRFDLVRKNEIFEDNISKALPQFQNISWLKPQYVAVQLAKDKNQRNDDMFAEVLGGISLAQRPERYVDFVQAKEQIQQRAKKIELLKKYNDKIDVEKILAKYPQTTAFLPMKASAVDMTVLIDQKANVVEIVDLRPWH
ncbi:TfpX/TfpZ family type IV pilin accessory protein [Acinetobacter terrestris]|uniref:TfpX/TfpZ family type IV pilin accessory protein n=1 Tax=Acinetobacter terrestris TaxID=2529843 RepID=A0AAW6UXB6_9GAMM|nr:TfpX/TfpZ family type IV pilin accessory protein [Acinetobacter terrestris]MDK1684500.1 TfpX/TfpZ family type IV pilin accessory protein [Acinetobacter terrestris]